MGRMFRAILSRLGRRTDAHAEAAGTTPVANNSDILYRVAGVYSLTSVIEAEDRDKAIAHLERAFKAGYNAVKNLKGERDLDAIRNHERFREIEDAATRLYQ